MGETISAISLLELNRSIRSLIDGAQIECWVVGEISEIHVSAASGHCYLELIEKSADGTSIVARQKASIWSTTYRMARACFEEATGSSLAVGMRILVRVAVICHEVYGISLNVKDIEPTFTIGEMERQRRTTIARLQADGVMDMNRECAMPKAPLRIAVISSATAAGYGDFLKQLADSGRHFRFATRLFAATMQGTTAPQSIIAALESVNESIADFDVVVIIRGGGGRSDLMCFDDYDLAANIAQFPIPVLTGIGHERDDSVADMVAYRRLKTPTAVAQFIIGLLEDAACELETISERMRDAVECAIAACHDELRRIAMQAMPVVHELVRSQCRRLDAMRQQAYYLCLSRLQVESAHIDSLAQKPRLLTQFRLRDESRRLQMLAMQAQMHDPEAMLKLGYAFVTANGVPVRSRSALRPGDEVEIHLADGKVVAVIK